MARHLLSWHFIYPVQYPIAFPRRFGSWASGSINWQFFVHSADADAAEGLGIFGRNENAKNVSPR